MQPPISSRVLRPGLTTSPHWTVDDALHSEVRLSPGRLNPSRIASCRPLAFGLAPRVDFGLASPYSGRHRRGSHLVATDADAGLPGRCLNGDGSLGPEELIFD